jgi:hypothetical protein
MRKRISLTQITLIAQIDTDYLLGFERSEISNLLNPFIANANQRSSAKSA